MHFTRRHLHVSLPASSSLGLRRRLLSHLQVPIIVSRPIVSHLPTLLPPPAAARTSASHRRSYASTSATFPGDAPRSATTPTADLPLEESIVPIPIYRGAMNNAVKVLKFFSVSSLGLSLIGMPLSMFFVDSALIQSNAVAAVMLSPTLMGSVTMFSTLSTLAAHKFLSPYVTRIFLIPPPTSTDSSTSSPSPQAHQPTQQHPITDDTTLAIETLTLFNTRRYTTVRMSELAYSTKSTITWELRDPTANATNTASKFMILLRKSGMSAEMRGCLQYIASKYRLLTMSDLTSEQLLTKLKGMSPPPVVGRPPRSQ